MKSWTPRARESSAATEPLEPLEPQNPSNLLEDPVHHPRRQFPRVRILAARVIAAEQRLAVRQSMRHAVAKLWTRPHRQATVCEQTQVRVKGDLAECNDDDDARQRAEFGVEMRQTAADFLWCGLVVRRRAPHGGGDERIVECQPIVRALRCGNARESRTMKRRHEEVAGSPDAVAGEHAACAVCAMRGRREADDEQSRPGIAKAWNRLCPVRVAAERAALLARDALTVSTQARAQLTGHDRGVDVLESRHGAFHASAVFSATVTSEEPGDTTKMKGIE